ncbi:hypothetical protein C8R44DRAFT_748506 [Mycena epipterygia]|nr:hypothetical protein C8R44DRAFT_748506 [Mycena epipterygia]
MTAHPAGDPLLHPVHYTFTPVTIVVHSVVNSSITAILKDGGSKWLDILARVANSVRRIYLHMMRVPKGNSSYYWVIPLRTSSSRTRMYEKFRRLAKSLQVDCDRIQSWWTFIRDHGMHSSSARLYLSVDMYNMKNLKTYLLNGYKNIDSNISFSPWKATTLFTTITRMDGSMVGRGTLRISWRNFASKLKSFSSSASSPKKLSDYVFSPLSPLEYPDRKHTGYFIKAAPAHKITLTARDGVHIRMKVWIPENDRGKNKLPILMIPGASVDDQILSLLTIPTNTVEYFTSLEQGYTAYDARLDVAAEMKFVHDQGPGKMYILTHRVSAIVTSMGRLDGTLRTEGIQGLTATQVFFQGQFGSVNAVKVRFPTLLPNMYKAVGGPWFPTTSTPTGPSIFQYLVDQVLRFYPVSPSAELCSSAVCHRCSLVFGRLWNHANLMQATHAHLINFVGRLISGGDSVVWYPVSTSMNYDILRERYDPALYRRVAVPGYGHLDTWMGKRSKDDVYPIVRDHLEWCERLPGGSAV